MENFLYILTLLRTFFFVTLWASLFKSLSKLDRLISYFKSEIKTALAMSDISNFQIKKSYQTDFIILIEVCKDTSYEPCQFVITERFYFFSWHINMEQFRNYMVCLIKRQFSFGEHYILSF